MEEITLKQGIGKALRSKGELIGSVEKSTNTTHPKYYRSSIMENLVYIGKVISSATREELPSREEIKSIIERLGTIESELKDELDEIIRRLNRLKQLQAIGGWAIERACQTGTILWLAP